MVNGTHPRSRHAMTFRTWAVALALGAWAVAGCKGETSGTDTNTGTDASLRDLSVAGDRATGMVPYFQAGTHLYQVTLSSSITTASVTATATDARAKLALAQVGQPDAALTSGEAAPVVVPDPGATSTVRVVSTSGDGTSSTGYTLRLTRRVAVGTDATLASLTDSLGELHFVAGTTTYSFDVLETRIAGYSITATATDPLAAVSVNGAPVVSGKPVGLALSVGQNVIAIRVASEDEQSQTTYTVTVNVLPSIAVKGISLWCPAYIGNGDLLVPVFDPPNATDTAVSWVSDNTTFASFDGSGYVVVAKPTRQFDPTVKITATSHDGGFTASCDVHVLWFADGFDDLAAGTVTSIRKWDLFPAVGPTGAFSVVTDGSQALRYDVGSLGGVLATVKTAAWPGGITGDYYVQARIKPINNTSNTSQKQLYLLGRYQDPQNWYGCGLNMQSTPRVEMNKMTPNANGYPPGSPSGWRFTSKNPAYDTWYTVRFEMVGGNLTMYYDNELLGTANPTDTAFTSGKVGLWTYNKSFEIDDVRVGDAADKPALLSITPNVSYAATVGDADRVITVTAQKPNYTSGAYDADTFTVASDAPGVVSTAVNGSAVSLHAAGAGTANITFTSGSDPSVTKTITATISVFTMPTATYNLTGATSPADNATGVNSDTRLSITFDVGSTPALGNGSVRIFRKSDNVLADVILPSGEIDALGYVGQSNVRKLNVSLLAVSGTTLTITPHHNALAYDTEYYVAIPNGLLTGTIALGGTSWTGIGTAGDWSFRTKSAPAAGLTSLTVDDDGAADFRTVQGALDYFMQNGAPDTAVTVNVKNGTHTGPLYLRNRNNVSIVGESRDGTVLQFRNAEALNGGSGASQSPDAVTPGGGRSLFLVEGSDLLTLQTLTLKNTYPRASSGAQAETIYFNNDSGRLVAKSAAFLSEQDTLQLKGWNWFYQCLVAGNVDYIWGTSHAALFENSEIRTIGDTANSTSGWYVVQSRVASASDKGFVFLNSQLTHGAGPTTGDVTTNVYLARAQNGAWVDNVVYVNCNMDTHIMAAGWYTGTTATPVYPVPNPATQTSGWREYKSMNLAGTALLDVSGRSAVSTQLSDGTYTSGYSNRAQIFSAYGSGGWNPTP